MMQQHTIHIAGGVVRNPLVRLTEPVTLDFLAGGFPGRRTHCHCRTEWSRKEPPGGYADGKVSFA